MAAARRPKEAGHEPLAVGALLGDDAQVADVGDPSPDGPHFPYCLRCRGWPWAPGRFGLFLTDFRQLRPMSQADIWGVFISQRITISLNALKCRANWMRRGGICRCLDEFLDEYPGRIAPEWDAGACAVSVARISNPCEKRAPNWNSMLHQ